MIVTLEKTIITIIHQKRAKIEKNGYIINNMTFYIHRNQID